MIHRTIHGAASTHTIQAATPKVLPLISLEANADSMIKASPVPASASPTRSLIFQDLQGPPTHLKLAASTSIEILANSESVAAQPSPFVLYVTGAER